MRLMQEQQLRPVAQHGCRLSHPPDHPAMLAGMSSRDVMIGSRYVPGRGTENWPIVREKYRGASTAWCVSSSAWRATRVGLIAVIASRSFAMCVSIASFQEAALFNKRCCIVASWPAADWARPRSSSRIVGQVSQGQHEGSRPVDADDHLSRFGRVIGVDAALLAAKV